MGRCQTGVEIHWGANMKGIFGCEIADLWHSARVPNPDPSDIPRPFFSRRTEFPPAPVPSPAEPAAERTESFHPQYVHLHTLREHGHGPRNLAWGVVTLFLALVLVGASLFVVGPRALLPLVVCLLTFTALFVLARMHVFRQRNGGFLALGIVSIFGAGMPLVERAFDALDKFIKSRPAAVVATVSAHPAAAVDSTLYLTEAFALTPPDPKSGPRVKVIKDAHVAIEGKSYLARTGDIYAFAARSGRDVTIAARDLLVTLPGDSVEILDDRAQAKSADAAAKSARTVDASAPEEPAANETDKEITARSQREAMRRYPALAVKGSMENQMYITLFTELRDNGDGSFFQNPEWPIEIAELLAKREHWQRGAAPASVGADSVPNDDTVVGRPATR